MRSVLICHSDSLFNRSVVAGWLNSFTDLAGIILVEDTVEARLRRVKNELRRVGARRFLDVLAFRIYYSLRFGATDSSWIRSAVERARDIYPPISPSTKIVNVQNPNSEKSKEFIASVSPDFVLARCKHILTREIYSIPSAGTFVLHPGICPEYRNSHGCFWAMVSCDYENIGTTLLKIDDGVDSGPIYGYFRVKLLSKKESHVVVQYRSVLENLDQIRWTLTLVLKEKVNPVDVSRRSSRLWGQPWLSRYLVWRYLLK